MIKSKWDGPFRTPYNEAERFDENHWLLEQERQSSGGLSDAPDDGGPKYRDAPGLPFSGLKTGR